MAAYAMATVLCASAGVLRSRRESGRDLVEVGFWFGLAGLMVLLVLFREWGLQWTLADEARDAAKSGGWYGDRRVYQAAIAGAIVASTGFVILIAIIAVGRRRRSFGLPIFASVSLMGFMALRALSLHQTDALFYRRRLEGVQINVLLELGLVALVALSAVIALVDKGPRLDTQRRRRAEAEVRQ
ncbi:MAG TPA: hypothetical protein VJB57_17510 [Dehalococcoidia bacterium]|nr:hypothetical protein [Dehalococcoidia bacterium]